MDAISASASFARDNAVDALPASKYCSAWKISREASQVLLPESRNCVVPAIPETMTDSIGHIFFKQARDRDLVRDNVSNEEALRWLLMIIISHGVFGFPELSEEAEKDYLRKMLVPSLFSIGDPE